MCLFLPFHHLIQHRVKVEVKLRVGVNVNKFARFIDEPTSITHFTQWNVQLQIHQHQIQ